MATEELGVYVMVAGSAAMLVLTIRILGIRRVVWALVLLVLMSLALGLKGLGAITTRRP
jgi:uncharacterized membrane protein